MKKTQFNAAELAEITAIQEQRSITRKSAIRVFEKDGRRLNLTNANKKAAVAPAPAVAAQPDVKSRAANDDTNKQPEAPKAPAAPKAPVPSTPAGDARKEGIRLFALAGKPKKQDFIHVYGPMGAKWTWVARAKAVGLNTAEDAAAQFQKMRAGKPGQFVKAEPTEKK